MKKILLLTLATVFSLCDFSIEAKSPTPWHDRKIEQKNPRGHEGPDNNHDRQERNRERNRHRNKSIGSNGYKMIYNVEISGKK